MGLDGYTLEADPEMAAAVAAGTRPAWPYDLLHYRLGGDEIHVISADGGRRAGPVYVRHDRDGNLIDAAWQLHHVYLTRDQHTRLTGNADVERVFAALLDSTGARPDPYDTARIGQLFDTAALIAANAPATPAPTTP